MAQWWYQIMIRRKCWPRFLKKFMLSKTRHEILEIISKWRNSSSATPDGIPFLFIKKMADVISAPLEFLFNLLFFQAVVPRSWRHAYVIPIRKKPPHCDPNNYRPVSITSVFCRLSEKILKKVIIRHITCNQVLSDHQHVTLMLEAMNDWTSVLDAKKSVDVIYFDFQKAFDKVSHPILLHKLARIGVHGRIDKWIEEFLADRTFQVLVNGHASTVRHAISGVPKEVSPHFI
ncbi:hypothetical protein COOONC_20126 [Cooperia oncophora]